MLLSLWQMESYLSDMMADVIAIVADNGHFVRWLMLLPLWQME